MSGNVQGLIEQGQRALQAGNRDEAQQFLMRATELEQENVDAWLWLAAAVETEEDQRLCLDNVLVLNPENKQAQQMIAELDRNSGAVDDFDSLANLADTLGTGEYETIADDSDSGVDLDDGPFSATSFSAAEDDTEDEINSFEDAFQVAEEEDDPLFSAGMDDDDDVSADLDAIESEPDDYRDELAADDYDDYVDYDETVDEYDNDFGGFSDEMQEEDVDYLAMLSDDVKPTRLPGTDMEEKPSGMTGLIVVAALNVVAVGLLLFQLLG
jgi:tetratricopeptide (TPR) repeat protein